MKLIFADKARKEFLKLDKPIQKQIKTFLLKLQGMEDPCSSGKALKSNLGGLWRYRVGDYRIICDIQQDKILITVLRIGHRKNVYDRDISKN